MRIPEQSICPSCHLSKPTASFYYPRSKNRREFCADCRQENAIITANNVLLREQEQKEIQEQMQNGFFKVGGVFIFDYRRWMVYKAKGIPKFFSKKAGQSRCKRRNGSKPEGSVYAYELYCLWKIQKGICPLTNEPLNSKNCQLDHIIPINAGGLNVISNVWWVRDVANSAKKDLPLHLYCQWRHLNYEEMCGKIQTIQESLKTMKIQITSPSLS